MLQPHEEIPIATVLEILTNPEEKVKSRVPPVRPKAGHVYLFAAEKQHVVFAVQHVKAGHAVQHAVLF